MSDPRDVIYAHEQSTRKALAALARCEHLRGKDVLRWQKRERELTAKLDRALEELALVKEAWSDELHNLDGGAKCPFKVFEEIYGEDPLWP